MNHYDLIGDIHGYAGKLKLMLRELGYEERGGTYGHADRKVIFLGDLVDRGPAIRETVRIVRAMVEAGSAFMVLGNHEFNAMAWNTPNGNRGWLRQHSDKNRHQHGETLRQCADPYQDEWQNHLEWFSRLPLFLDLGCLRAVHAGWHGPSAQRFRGVTKLDAKALARMTTPNSPDRQARDILINGLEIDLPEGATFIDKSGNAHDHIRTRWWANWEGASYREVIYPDSDSVPEMPLSEVALARRPEPYPADAPPVFFGHYWLDPSQVAAPVKQNIACLDYSVAKGGPLTAYRFDGEAVLEDDRFVQV